MKLQFITTTFPDNEETVKIGKVKFADDTGIENQVINLYPGVKYQTFEGYGGAFTESAGYVYSRMDDKLKEELLDNYFSKDKMNYTMGRIHMDSCDFTLGHYEAMSDPEDREMKSFSIERMRKYVIPFLKDAERVSGRKLEVMATPWSPPSFMKTNGERDHGGGLKKEYYGFWAEYLCRYITELRKEGINICRMSLQNEPHAVQNWDSCIYTGAEEKEFLRDYLYPALVNAGLEDIEIFIWDHNKERAFERASEIIDEETDRMIAGIALHWYSGDHFEALDMIRQKFPGKKMILSEACIEYYKFSADDYLANAQKYAHDMIGNMNGGMTGFYDWNLVLDEKGGPNHVKNYCDAPYMYNMTTGRLMERNILAYLRHFSRYIRPGAQRIGMSRYTADLDVTAFQNTDGTIAAVILNTTDKPRDIVVRMDHKAAKLQIDAQAIMTVTVCEE